MPKQDEGIKLEAQLIEDMASFEKNPYAWVLYSFRWNEDELEGYKGPDKWQEEALKYIRDRLQAKQMTPTEAVSYVIKIAVASGNGPGKAQPKDLMIYTPAGLQKFGDLKPGDYVYGSDGRPTRIIETYDRGIRPTYKVTFDDNSSTITCGEHIWKVRGHSQRRRDRVGGPTLKWITKTTAELSAAIRRKNGGGGGYRQWEIPAQVACEIEQRDVVIHPYILGLWLGNGNKDRLTTEDQEIISKCRELHKSISIGLKKKNRAVAVCLHKIQDPLRKLGLYNKLSYNKFVPDDYKYNSYNVRLSVLQGLIDTDGTIGRDDGTVEFCVTSKQLCEDVVWLVRSLGGKAWIKNKIKDTWYYDKNRKRVPCRPAYRVHLRMPNGVDCCTLAKKKNRLKPCSQDRYLHRWIDSIEPTGEQDCMCISVANPDGLYLTNDFIVTHNSALVAWIILWALSTYEDTRGVVTANTETQLRTKTWSELSKWYRLFIAKHWFELTATAIYAKAKEHERTWRIDQVPWSEHNTEAFAGLHNKGKRIVVVFDEACHDDQTEVMTDSGWKYFNDLSGDELFLSMNPETQFAEYVKAVALHKSPHDGDMYVYAKRGIDFKVTPSHKLFTKTCDGHNKGKKLGFRWDEARNLPKNSMRYVSRQFKWEQPDIDKFTLPGFESKRKVFKQVEFDFDLWAQFLGWYCSEGNLIKKSQADGVVAYNGVAITQKDKATLSEIYTICDKLGLTSRIYNTPSTPQVHIFNRALAEFLSTYGSDCLVKTIPECIRFASKRQINLFLATFLRGDGYRRRNRNIFYTSSKRIADVLQELVLKSGAQSTVMIRNIKGQRKWILNHWAESSCDGYVVSQTFSNTDGCIRTKELKTEKYKGLVYCVSLEKYHLLFTRRNGVCMWSGNSAIPDTIWDVTEGALTDKDTQILWLVFGNPTRNTGRFRECWGKFRSRWKQWQLDIRKSILVNQQQVQEWITDLGIDCDWVRVHVLGLFPKASDLQFISTDLITPARGRQIKEHQYNFAPKIIGVDMAWSGGDEIVIGMRQGLVYRQLQVFEKNEDDSVIASAVAKWEDTEHTDAVHIDLGYGTGVFSFGKQMNRKWTLVSFGGKSSKPGFANKRSEMWADMKQWLKEGGCIPDDQRIVDDLAGPEAYPNLKGEIILESKKDMKKRGLASPSRADALALTFAHPVMKKKPSDEEGRKKKTEADYDPLAG